MADPTLNSVQRQIFSASRAAQSYLCVNTKTAADVPGRNQLNPLEPGHATVSRYDVDESSASSRLVGTISAYPSSTLDNFRSERRGNDVVFDDPRDVPDAEHYPFSYCAPVAPGGLAAMGEVAERFGDYQFASHNCVDFASEAFEAATQQCILGTPRETILDIGSPRELGARINELNGFAPTVAPLERPFSIEHGREGGLFSSDRIQAGGERFDIVGSNGDRLGYGVDGPSLELGDSGFDASAGSVSIGLDGRAGSGSFGFDVGVSLGVSGGLYTGEDGRYGLDLPFLGGFVAERADDGGFALETQVGPFDLELHADGGAFESISDSISSTWDSITSVF
ncbi:MAG: hypothetical protein IT454_15275 [Planctomycetes bacterium]|nr:hypothetical protein [Planctomycetota bacterium]